MIKPTRRVLALESVRVETADVRTFRFNQSYDLEPGQFVNIRFSGDDTIGRRSFSIASGPGEPLELTIKAVGAFTKAIFQAPIGTEFEVLGPLGLPYIRGNTDPHVLIAGGSGIAPFRSIMRDPAYASVEFVLIDSNKTCEDIIYRDEMREWHCTITHTLTREEHEGMRFGRISQELLESIEGYATRRYLICGPPGMVSTAIEHLVALGIPMNRIKTESWGN